MKIKRLYGESLAA